MEEVNQNDKNFEIWCDDRALANPVEIPPLTPEQERRREEFLNKPLPSRNSKTTA